MSTSEQRQQAAIEEAIEARFEALGLELYEWPWVYEDLRQAVEAAMKGGVKTDEQE